MTNYNYTGVTAYIQKTMENKGRIRALAAALYVLKPYVNPQRLAADVDIAHKLLVDSLVFDQLFHHAGMTAQDAFYFPDGTPADYTHASVTHLEINGIEMTRLYMPFVAKRHDDIQDVVHNAYLPVLTSLFGQDLVAVKSKSTIDGKNFNTANEQVLVSTKPVNA